MDGQAHHDRINAQLSDMFGTGTTEGKVTGGSFTYTESELRTIKDNWLDLANSYRTSFRNAEFMTRVQPPAEDMASKLHAAAANRSGESYKDYLEHNRRYCLQQAQLFQDALDDYLGVEHNNVTDINNTGQHGPQDGV
ncbi:hypothetical protein [Actinophytocola glycyrrhizae]|uniref:PE domain-containing protein n=1 Tax=Actinophytocola glycyrrhizae TaxID=2044873 RepID=A0ABV9RVH7_9PSEU